MGEKLSFNRLLNCALLVYRGRGFIVLNKKKENIFCKYSFKHSNGGL
jgi:hypothetical protein